jgi:hypothetical protein
MSTRRQGGGAEDVQIYVEESPTQPTTKSFDCDSASAVHNGMRHVGDVTHCPDIMHTQDGCAMGYGEGYRSGGAEETVIRLLSPQNRAYE